MRIVFAGTPQFAAAALIAILDAGFSVPLVLTQPDRPSGRGQRIQVSSVKAAASARGIPVHQPTRFRAEQDLSPIAAVSPDVLVVAAYGLLLPQVLLDLPRSGAINIHASLLPRWRGAAPIQRALLAGDRQTGISIMQMDAGLDTGPIISAHPVDVGATETAGTLHDRLTHVGAEAIVAALKTLSAEGALASYAQPADGATYAAKIVEREALIDWKLPAAHIERQVRAFNPVPGAVTSFRGLPLKVWESEPVDYHGMPGTILDVRGQVVVGCGEGALALFTVQRAGGKRMPATALAAGGQLKPGTVLGTLEESIPP